MTAPVLSLTILNATTVRITVTPATDPTYDTCHIFRRVNAGAYAFLVDVASGDYDDTVSASSAYVYEAVAVDAAGVVLGISKSVSVPSRSTAASEMLALPISYLRAMIADSAAFQLWTGSDDGSEALGRVHVVSTGLGNTPELPFALVDWAGNFRMMKIAGGALNVLRPSGSLQMWFRAPITIVNDADAAVDFYNHIGAVLDDIASVSGKAGYLNITSISRLLGPERPQHDEKQAQRNADGTIVGDYYQVIYGIEYEG